MIKPAAKRAYGILGSFLMIALAFVVYSAMIVPAYERIQELRGEREALHAAVIEEQASVEAVEDLISLYSDLESSQEKLSRVLPNEKEVATVVNQLDGISNTNGVLMTALSMRLLPVEALQVGTVIKPVGTLRLDVQLIGNYGSLKSYLKALETNLRIMDVRSIKVGEAGTSEGPYEYSLEVDTYYQI